MSQITIRCYIETHINEMCLHCFSAHQSTFSSSHQYWFTMGTCIQDISLRIAAALPHLVVLQRSAHSGFGSRMTQYAKPVFTRCCHRMLTCSSMKEYKYQHMACIQRSRLHPGLLCLFHHSFSLSKSLSMLPMDDF